jgi:hypothetical protein
MQIWTHFNAMQNTLLPAKIEVDRAQMLPGDLGSGYFIFQATCFFFQHFLSTEYVPSMKLGT